MALPIDYRFKVTAGDRLRDPACRDRFFRLVTNWLEEQLASGLSLEGTRLSFKTSLLTGSVWFTTGRIEVHAEQSPITVECALSLRRWSLVSPLAPLALAILSAIWPETVSVRTAVATLASSVCLWVLGYWGGGRKFKDMIQTQIATLNSDAGRRSPMVRSSL